MTECIKVPTYQPYKDIGVEGGLLRSYRSDTVIRYNGKRFGIGIIPTGSAGTVVLANRGPGRAREVVDQPEAYTYGLSVCIDNFGGTGRESAEKTAAGTEFELEDGDRVTFEIPEGLVTFTVGPLIEGSRVRRDYLALTLSPTMALDRVARLLTLLDVEDDEEIRADARDELIALGDAYGGEVRKTIRDDGRVLA